EGEFRYWAPIGGTDFAGDLIRYGVGLVYGMHASNEIWLTPVAEVVGWTIFDGHQQVVGPGGFFTQSAVGTIVNASLGVRFGLGDHADIYAGYSRCFTAPRWVARQARGQMPLLLHTPNADVAAGCNGPVHGKL